MLGKTHMAVGVATSLLLLQPQTLPELILGAGTAAVGSVISDIDCGTSDSSRKAEKIIFILETLIVVIAAVEARWHLGLYQKLMANSSASRMILACAAFIAVCAYGKKTPHRSFLHSFLADFRTILAHHAMRFDPLSAAAMRKIGYPSGNHGKRIAIVYDV